MVNAAKGLNTECQGQRQCHNASSDATKDITLEIFCVEVFHIDD